MTTIMEHRANASAAAIPETAIEAPATRWLLRHPYRIVGPTFAAMALLVGMIVALGAAYSLGLGLLPVAVAAAALVPALGAFYGLEFLALHLRSRNATARFHAALAKIEAEQA